MYFPTQHCWLERTKAYTVSGEGTTRGYRQPGLCEGRSHRRSPPSLPRGSCSKCPVSSLHAKRTDEAQGTSPSPWDAQRLGLSFAPSGPGQNPVGVLISAHGRVSPHMLHIDLTSHCSPCLVGAELEKRPADYHSLPFLHRSFGTGCRASNTPTCLLQHSEGSGVKRIPS